MTTTPETTTPEAGTAEINAAPISLEPAPLTSWRAEVAENQAAREREAGDGPLRRVMAFRRRAMAVSIGIGAALTFAGFATTNWEGTSKKADYLNSLAETPTRSQVAAVLLHFGYMAFLPMLLALGVFTRRRAVKLGHVGLGIGLLGALSLPGLLVTDFYDLAIRQHLPLDKAVEVSDAPQHYGWAIAIGGPIVMGVFVGMFLLLIAAWRARFIGWWPAVFWAAGFVIAFTPKLTPALIGSGLVAIAMTALAVRIWRTTDEEWATSVAAR
jgi:hypothetical protein